MASCLHPIYNKTTGLLVPCGKCVNCLKRKQNKYVVLATEEAKRWRACGDSSLQTGFFFTLTYNDLHLPYNNFKPYHDFSIQKLGYNIPSLRFSDVNDALHYIRKWASRHGFPTDYSYLWCGEYGSHTNRPHYHAMIFGMPKEVARKLTSYWESKYGFVMRKEFPLHDKDSCNVSRYIAKYATKGCFDDPYSLQGFRPKGRIFTSHYFGTNYLSAVKLQSILNPPNIKKFNASGAYSEEYLKHLFNHLNYSINGYKYQIPDTLVEKILPKHVSRVDYEDSVLGKVHKEQIIPLSLRSALSVYRIRHYDDKVNTLIAQRRGIAIEEVLSLPFSDYAKEYCDICHETQSANAISEQSANIEFGFSAKRDKF